MHQILSVYFDIKTILSLVRIVLPLRKKSNVHLLVSVDEVKLLALRFQTNFHCSDVKNIGFNTFLYRILEITFNSILFSWSILDLDNYNYSCMIHTIHNIENQQNRLITSYYFLLGFNDFQHSINNLFPYSYAMCFILSDLSIYINE